MASLDVNRPAAQEQLAVLGEQTSVATLPIIPGQQPVDEGEADRGSRLQTYQPGCGNNWSVAVIYIWSLTSPPECTPRHCRPKFLPKIFPCVSVGSFEKLGNLFSNILYLSVCYPYTPPVVGRHAGWFLSVSACGPASCPGSAAVRRPSARLRTVID